MGRLFLALGALLPLFPSVASAHEVYVLDHATILADIATSSPNPFSIIPSHQYQFFFWFFIGLIVFLTVFFMSITHWFERVFNPWLTPLKGWATLVARVTLGICLVASAYHNALFGPELPLSDFAGAFAPAAAAALYISGALILFGLWTRAGALLALVLFLFSLMRYDIYMLTYANYFGEIVLVAILGSGRWGLDRVMSFGRGMSDAWKRARSELEQYAFLILRISFGLSLIYASVFAKFLHSQLALDVVTRYHLTDYLHFDPLFIVLGASIIEFATGLLILLGIEIRHTALFLLFWLTLSLLYFGESVWPHIVIVGVLVALFMHGYDRYSLEGYFFKHRKREPVF